jgi:hypothetical protein
LEFYLSGALQTHCCRGFTLAGVVAELGASSENRMQIRVHPTPPTQSASELKNAVFCQLDPYLL